MRQPCRWPKQNLPPPSNEAVDDPVLADTGLPADQAIGNITGATLTYTDATGHTQRIDLRESDEFELPNDQQAILRVDVDTSETTDNKVEITIPKGMVVTDYPKREVMAALVSSVDASRLGTQDFGGYKPQCGTVAYSLTDAAPKITLELVVAADTILWNGLDGTQIGGPLKIRATHGSAESGSVQATGTITGTPSGALQLQMVNTTGVTKQTSKDHAFACGTIRVYTGRPIYCDELTLVVSLPRIKGTEKYARFDHLEFDAYSSGEGNMLDPAVNSHCVLKEPEIDNTNHTVAFTWEDVYLPSVNEWVTPFFYWDDGDDAPSEADNTLDWRNENINYTLVYGAVEGDSSKPCAASAKSVFEDQTVGYWANERCAEKADGTTQYVKLMTITSTANLVYAPAQTTQTNRNIVAGLYSDVACSLARFTLQNSGGADTDDKTMYFEYLNTDKVGVTAQVIPAASGCAVTVRYKTNKDVEKAVANGQTADKAPLREYPQALKAKDNRTVFTAQMADLEEGEYFVAIEADVGSFPSGFGTREVVGLNEGNTDRALITFGRVFVKNSGNTQVVKVSSATTGSDTLDPGPITVQVYLSNVLKASGLGLTARMTGNKIVEPVLSSPVLVDGGTVHFNTVVSSTTTPTTMTTPFVDDTEIYIRLPKCVEPSNLVLTKLTGSTSDNIYRAEGYEGTRRETGTVKSTSLVRDVDYEISKPIDLGEGWALWAITFKGDAGHVGWFNKDLTQTQIQVAFDMTLVDASETRYINMRECVFVVSGKMKQLTEGLPSRYGVEDTYGILAKTAEARAADETAAPVDTDKQLCTFSYTNFDTYFVIEAARCGNTPTVIICVNGGTAPAGMEPLLLVDEGGQVTLPPAPAKKGRTFEGWVCSDGRTYQPGDKLAVGADNIALAAKWSGEPAPKPSAANPFEFTVNESGVNYGGSGADPNADATGKVPEKVARRAEQAAAGIVPGPGDYDPEPGAGASAGAGAGAQAGTGSAAATAGGATAATSLAKPPATKISKLKAAKKAFTVKWAKKSKKKVDGYQVRWSLKKNMKSAKTKTVKGAAKASLTVKKLKAGKKYYVQVRTYKKVGKKTVYSAWSAKKAVKVKK